jgi:hypothetical protein
LWVDAPLSHLVLLRVAINRGWPVPNGRRRPIVNEISQNFQSRSDAGDTRGVLAMAKVVMAMERYNLRSRIERVATDAAVE